MQILYLDCPTGISGDMCLASLIDLGVDENRLKRELKKLKTDDYRIKVTHEMRHSIRGTRFIVKTGRAHGHRTFKDIKTLIEKSRLSPCVKKLSVEIFRNLAIAEGKVHGIKHLNVEFHEVGAVDSIVDIVGVAIAINELKVTDLYSSPLPMGSGWVDTAHGKLPIPAPATVELLKGTPVVPTPLKAELTTPTGAAIIKTLTKGFGMRPMIIEKIGYGIGERDFKEAPNAMRAILGKKERTKENLIAIETNIDDTSPQLLGYLMERLLKEGARDVFFTPVVMKKSRPAALLTILADEDKKDALTHVIFKESTSIGIRFHPVERICLERKIAKAKTPYGNVRVKLSRWGEDTVNIQPEYEDCRKIAEKKKMPLKEIMDIAKESIRKYIKY